MSIIIAASFFVFLGLLFDFTNGFHDVANVVSTTIHTKALSKRSAIFLAAVFNTLGATHIGAVAKTITEGIIVPSAVHFALILAAILSAIIWNLATWKLRIPSSSSYALIGGLVGVTFLHVGEEALLWKGILYKVLIPMILSPFLGFIAAFCIQKIASRVWKEESSAFFASFQIIAASLLSYAHGMNDAQKSMGLITLGLFSLQLIPSLDIPLWIIFSCAATMGIGTFFGGMRIINTMGQIIDLEQKQGFSADLSSSTVIIGSAFLGMPISSTQVIVGSITGSFREFATINWSIARKIVWGWLFTIPGSALLSIIIYKILIVLELSKF